MRLTRGSLAFLPADDNGRVYSQPIDCTASIPVGLYVPTGPTAGTPPVIFTWEARPNPDSRKDPGVGLEWRPVIDADGALVDFDVIPGWHVLPQALHVVPWLRATIEPSAAGPEEPPALPEMILSQAPRP